MAYQIYFADLRDENQALFLTLLRLKEEAGRLEPDEAELLLQLRGPGSFMRSTAEPSDREADGEGQTMPRRPGGFRRRSNGRPHHSNGN